MLRLFLKLGGTLVAFVVAFILFNLSMSFVTTRSDVAVVAGLFLLFGNLFGTLFVLLKLWKKELKNAFN
jgi:hypothetical protein